MTLVHYTLILLLISLHGLHAATEPNSQQLQGPSSESLADELAVVAMRLQRLSLDARGVSPVLSKRRHRRAGPVHRVPAVQVADTPLVAQTEVRFD